MLGISYRELFLLLGATAALIGPKDLPIVARTTGRLVGRAIGYVQLARCQFNSAMQQTQARQVHKELQDTMTQLEAIRYEIRSIPFLNPGPLSRRLVDDIDHEPAIKYLKDSMERIGPQFLLLRIIVQQSQIHVICTSKLLLMLTLKTSSLESDRQVEISDESDLTILPISAESAGMLPKCSDDVKGSDIVLEAILEAEVARNAKDFFAQPQNQIKYE